jgi:hypothetical protein
LTAFTGGQLPPKSAIREIRINQNPFSAEFDRIGYGRIEILTKPGTDKLHGRVFGQGTTSGLNTGNPFLSPLPSYTASSTTALSAAHLQNCFVLSSASSSGTLTDDSIYYLANAPVFNSVTATTPFPWTPRQHALGQPLQPDERT